MCDLTAGNGVLAFQALQQNICYLGVCYNDYHMVELYKHLADLTFDAMWSEGSALYDSKLAELLKGEGAEVGSAKADVKESKEKKKKRDDAEETAGSTKKQKKSGSSADSLLAQLQALRGTGKKKVKATDGEDEEEDDDEDNV